MPSLKCRHPEASAVIGLARLHAYQNGVFWLVDVPQKYAETRRIQLSRMGWTVVHTEIV